MSQRPRRAQRVGAGVLRSLIRLRRLSKASEKALEAENGGGQTKIDAELRRLRPFARFAVSAIIFFMPLPLSTTIVRSTTPQQALIRQRNIQQAEIEFLDQRRARSGSERALVRDEDRRADAIDE